MPYDLTKEQWTQLLSLLSLDGVLSLYEDMAVPVTSKIDFQTTLREVILKARRLYETNPDHVPAVSEMLLERLGMPAAESFASWARGSFLGYHADQPDWSAWDIVFSQWAYSRSRDLDFLPKEKRDAVVATYRKEVDTADVKQKGQEILNGALTDWDLEIFGRHGYGCSWESSPYSTVEAIVRIQRLKTFARGTWQNLSANERESLQKQAQVLIDELRVWMPGHIPRLDALLGVA